MANDSLTQSSPNEPADQPKSGSTSSATANGTNNLSFIPEDLKNEKFWSTVKDSSDLARKYAEMVKYQGRSVALLGKDAKPEDWEAFHAKFRPEKPDSYEMSREGWPEGAPYNENFEKSAREQFHKLGLTTEQGKNLYNWYIEQNKAEFENIQHRYDKGQDDLRAKWGNNYDREFGIAQRAMLTVLNNNIEHPLIKWLDQSGESRNPVLIEFFNELGKGLGEDNTRPEETSVPTDEEMREVDKKIAEMRADPKGAYMDVNHPGHKLAVDEMYKLYQKKNELQAG
jgi:hypothetical protein